MIRLVLGLAVGAIALGSGCSWTAKGGLGVECGADDDCVSGLTCAGSNGGSGICSSACGSNGDCGEGACVETAEGDFCAFRCQNSADCEVSHECWMSSAGTQVCWFEDISVAAKGGLGAACGAEDDCMEDLLCAEGGDVSGICTTSCTSEDDCSGGACVETELGDRCAAGCDSSADCEIGHKCRVSADLTQVCWFDDANLIPLPKFTFSHVTMKNGNPVAEISVSEAGRVQVAISATFSGRGTATDLWASAIKTTTASVHWLDCKWSVPDYDTRSCPFNQTTEEFDCAPTAAAIGRPAVLEPGETGGPYLRLQFDFNEGATVEPLQFSFNFGDAQGDEAVGEIEIEVVP